ncbi:hypothetical protein Q3G72_031499 [Acer saccharum]|nr:hypothetical protein Q3G72_031499 [Acer saccharum]
MHHGLVNPNTLTYLGSLMACSGLQALSEGHQIHGVLWKLGIQTDFCIESALMDMYSKCGSVQDAWRIFESAEELDEVSMTVILVGFAQNGFEEEAIQFFAKMVKAGIEIVPNMVSAILGVFGVDTSLGLGKQIHSLIIKRSFTANPFVSNGLINLYSKCGDLEESIKVFSRMPNRNSISWNSMIAAFARHGLLNEAKSFIEGLPMKPDEQVWQALLGACSIHGDSEIGKYAADQLFLASPESPATYILMANIYSSRGRWKERARIIKRMKEMGVDKDSGVSWIEIEKKTHSFVVDNRLHPQIEIIYRVLVELFGLMIDEGYVRDKRFIFHYLNQEEKEMSNS